MAPRKMKTIPIEAAPAEEPQQEFNNDIVDISTENVNLMIEDKPVKVKNTRMRKHIEPPPTRAPTPEPPKEEPQKEEPKPKQEKETVNDNRVKCNQCNRLMSERNYKYYHKCSATPRIRSRPVNQVQPEQPSPEPTARVRPTSALPIDSRRAELIQSIRAQYAAKQKTDSVYDKLFN